jgi:ankyrin repeat protein
MSFYIACFGQCWQWKGTGLHRASKFGFPKIVRLLLQNGAEADFLDQVRDFLFYLQDVFIIIVW